jgi:hypothetical protein
MIMKIMYQSITPTHTKEGSPSFIMLIENSIVGRWQIRKGKKFFMFKLLDRVYEKDIYR